MARKGSHMADNKTTEDIFARALDLTSTDERVRFLEAACEGNGELRQEIETLLHAHEEAGDFLGNQASTLRVSVALPQAESGEEQPPKIAGFRIVRCLGRGGIGAVYEAIDEKLQRRVALKTLHSVPDADVRRRILDEARKIAALRDPAIVTVHSVLDEHEPPAIVMELIEGFPIADFATSLSCEQKARILQEIARALSAAHRQGIIHRDLKPANVLVTAAMKPVVLDFGLAISTEEAADRTSSAAVSRALRSTRRPNRPAASHCPRPRTFFRSAA
jgi:serine/threonine protein kinase